MKFVTWNVARGGCAAAWKLLADIGADIALVQEAKHERLPASAIWNGPARRKNGKPQPWGSAVIAGPAERVRAFPLSTQVRPWVARWLAGVGGAVVAAEVATGHGEVVLMSCYSPAWATPPEPSPSAAEIASVKLKATKKSQVWVADLVWACVDDLRHQGRQVIAAGDFNLSVAFDETFGAGNREYVQRMADSELTEIVRHFHPDEASTPTFRNARSKRIEHQLDYVWVTPGIRSAARSCSLGDQQILLRNVSDHVPIVFEIDL